MDQLTKCLTGVVGSPIGSGFGANRLTICGQCLGPWGSPTEAALWIGVIGTLIGRTITGLLYALQSRRTTPGNGHTAA